MRKAHRTSANWHTYTEGEAREQLRRERREKRGRFVPPAPERDTPRREPYDPDADDRLLIDEGWERDGFEVAEIHLTLYSTGRIHLYLLGHASDLWKALRRACEKLWEEDGD